MMNTKFFKIVRLSNNTVADIVMAFDSSEAYEIGCKEWNVPFKIVECSRQEWWESMEMKDWHETNEILAERYPSEGVDGAKKVV